MQVLTVSGTAIRSCFLPSRNFPISCTANAFRNSRTVHGLALPLGICHMWLGDLFIKIRVSEMERLIRS